MYNNSLLGGFSFPYDRIYSENEQYSLNTPFKWKDERINVEFDLIREGNNSSLKAEIPANEYPKFQSMQGTIRCVKRTSGEEFIITFLPEDIIHIISDDYEVVNVAYQSKCEKYLMDREKKWLAQEEEKRKQKEAEETERMSHFWYRLFHRKKASNAG